MAPADVCSFRRDGQPSAQAAWQESAKKRFANIETVVMRKLAMLNRAGSLDDLRDPLGNRLEALEGNRAGQYSIRINDQFGV